MSFPPLLQGGRLPHAFCVLSHAHQRGHGTSEPAAPPDPVGPARPPGQRADAYLGGRHALAPQVGACGSLSLARRHGAPGNSLPVWEAAEAAVGPGSVLSRLPPHALPPSRGSGGCRQPIGWTAGPRGARDPLGLCPAAGQAWVRWVRAGCGHVSPTEFSRSGDSRGRGPDAPPCLMWSGGLTIQASCEWYQRLLQGPGDPEESTQPREVENSSRSHV